MVVLIDEDDFDNLSLVLNPECGAVIAVDSASVD